MIKTNWMKRLLAALCIVCIALATIVAIPVVTTASAANINVSNGDFSAYSSTDYTPTSWTKSGDNNSEIYSGVYDGKVGFDKHGFDNSDVLSHENSYKEFLVFNSKNFTAYSAYSSSDITLAGSSYYQFTVKAKAMVTTDNAYFSITGLDEEISLPIVNDGIWATYKIYLATDFDTAASVRITLSLGKNEAKAKGWAMFDDVSAESLTVHDYYAIEESDNILMMDISTPYDTETIKGGDFTTLDYDCWTVGGSKENASVSIIPATYTDIPGQDGTVTAPNFIGTTNNVLRIASTDDNGGYITLTSNEFTVKPDEYYRVSYFVMDEGNTSSTGVGATAKLYYKYANTTGEFKNVTVNNIQTATPNASHFGWTERAFYIKGSSFVDLTAKIEFALGSENSTTAGGVLIDDVRIQKLTPERFNEIAPDSSVLANADAGITDNSGVTNGEFFSYTITDGKRIPANWTLINAGVDNVASYGYSANSVNTDNATYEVVNASDPAANIGKYELALKMSSTTETVFGMRSAAISVSSGAYKMISVNLSALSVTGYGANIVIRRDNGAIVDVVENITDAGNYNFCVKGDNKNSVTLYVEIWLGLFDRNKNLDKLAAGTIYVNKVTSADSTEEVYNAYLASTSNNNNASSVAFEDAWLAHNEKDANKTLYNWTIEKADSTAKVEYALTTLDDETVIKYTNASPNASAIILTPAISITASSYYKVTVQLKIVGSLDDIDTNAENYKGAWAGIITNSDTYDTTKYTVKNIKETTLTTDKTNYVTLEFFVRAADADSTVSLFVALGENIPANEGEEKTPYTQGTVYIKGIKVEDSSTSEYTDVENSLKDTQVLVNLASDEIEEEEETQTSTSLDPQTFWLMIGSIFFSVALIAVVVVVFVKKFAKKHANKPVQKKGRPEYDRANVANNKNNAKVDKTSGAVELESDIDRFSDENESTEAVTETEETTATEETVTEESETTEETPASDETVTEETTSEQPAEESNAESQDDTQN